MRAWPPGGSAGADQHVVDGITQTLGPAPHRAHVITQQGVGPERQLEAADALRVEQLDRSEFRALPRGEGVQVGASRHRDARAGMPVDAVGQDPGLVRPLGAMMPTWSSPRT